MRLMPTENAYLDIHSSAIEQLCQYLSPASTYNKTPADGTGLREEWVKKRSPILGCLATATNSGNDTVEPLDDFALIAGNQTVKTFRYWHN